MKQGNIRETETCRAVSGVLSRVGDKWSVLIVSRLEEFAYAEAIAVGVVLLTMSFVMLIAINLVDRWSKKGRA